MKHYHSIVVTILLVLLTGCASTPQFKKVSTEEAFSAIRALAKEKSQSLPGREGLYTQPANKSVPCKLSTTQDQLDRNNFRAYWDGECKDGFAYGLGRDISISDTHHVEEITIYGDNGKTLNSPSVFYDFVHQFVGYKLEEDGGSRTYRFEEHITNKGANFNFEYRLGEFVKNGNSYLVQWNPFAMSHIRASIIENVVYEYETSIIKPINTRVPLVHFQTIDNKTGSPIGFKITKYANGQVRHVKVDNGEEVTLPDEYLSMVHKNFQEISESNSRVEKKVKAVKMMEKEYLYRACNGKYEISGLEKKFSNRICTWRNQFKEPFELARNRFNQSLERMKAEAQAQAEQQRIQDQLNYQRRMAEAAERGARAAENQADSLFWNSFDSPTTCYSSGFGMTTCF